jgi:hypothetical protein
MRPIHTLITGILLSSLMATAQEPTAKPQFDAINFFVGHWRGTAHGEPGDGSGERVYEMVLRGKFLRVSNKTVYPPQKKNPKGEVHEDLGFFSYDGQRKKLVFRQFHVEGFVNEYVEQESTQDGNTLVFETERIENIPDGWRARETYKILNQDEYIEVFELAEPQKQFATYAESHWTRMK